MSEEGQLYELTKELVEQITGRYTEDIQDPDYQIAWTYLYKALNIRNVVGWVAIESNEQPEKVTSVIVKYKDGTKEVALFDGDGRYYIEPEYNDVTDKIIEWHRLP